MTLRMNKGPSGYRPFGPQPVEVRLMSHVGRVAEPVERGSLYYLCPEYQKDQIASITDYQEWAESGWKEQHGTYEAADRFAKKLLEEVGELREANQLFEESGCGRDSECATELLSELGDVLWCATALASNSSADIDAAMRYRMFEYVHGVKHREGDQTLDPVWFKMAGSLSVQSPDISLADVSNLIVGHFEPVQSIMMNIEQDEPEFDVVGHIDLLVKPFAGALRVCVDRQYGRTHNPFGEDGSYDEIADEIAQCVSEIYLNVAYIAHIQLGKSLNDVVAKNMAKLTARVSAQRVDKSDGTRDAKLL